MWPMGLLFFLFLNFTILVLLVNVIYQFNRFILILSFKHVQDTFVYKYVPPEERESEDKQSTDAAKKRVRIQL